jgi:predicted nuclease with TOPRIM domain
MEIKTEISLLDHRLSTMEHQLEELKLQIQEINNKTNQLLDALIGNPISQAKGLAADFKEIKKKVYEHDQVLKQIKWFWAGVLVVGTILAVIINFIFQLIK